MSTSQVNAPKHVLVREELRAVARASAPGTLIESERELMQRFGVSRATVRLAIQALVDDGLLIKEPARGTFVAPQRVESRLHLASFTQDMLRRGHVPETRVLSMTVADPGEVAGEFLYGIRTWRIERLRLADGEPMAYEMTYISTEAAPILNAAELHTSLYALLRDRFDVTIDNAEQSVTAVAADTRQSEVLSCRENAPLLLFERHGRAGDTPVERTRSWYLGDRYSLHVALDTAMRPD